MEVLFLISQEVLKETRAKEKTEKEEAERKKKADKGKAVMQEDDSNDPSGGVSTSST